MAENEVPGVGSGRKSLKQLSISALSELLLCLFSQKGKLTQSSSRGLDLVWLVFILHTRSH